MSVLENSGQKNTAHACVAALGACSFLALLAGCGLDDTGVRTVTFDLRPTAASQLAEVGVDAGPTVVFELMSATGRATVNALTDQGLVTARDLPSYARHTYLVRLDVAPDDRSALPTATPAKLEGHVFAMTEDVVGSGRWRLAFDTIPDHDLGALRAATIFLVKTETATIADGGHHVIKAPAVLTGSAADVTNAGTTSATGGGAHVHGL